jgi:small-conductance mechanosensitive channel
MTLDEFPAWIAAHGLALIVGVLILFVLYRFAQPLVHRLVSGVLHAQQATLATEGAPDEELQKRAATLEALLIKLIRAAFVFGLIVLVLAVFDLWELLAGLGLFAAALTLAGQAIVLDYLMGILILVEGPYFKGDWIAVDAQSTPVEGEVTEIGLRRTVIRDGLGAEHSISNGLIRLSSNLTRVYSVVTVDVQILRAQDIERAIAIAATAGQELDDDPELKGRLLDTPTDTAVLALTLDGATIRVQRRVPPSLRGRAGSELRRRLATAFAAEGIGTGRWDTPLPAAPLLQPGAEQTAPGSPAP